MTTTASAQKPRIGAVLATVFIDLLGFGIVIPLLPIYSKVYGADELQLGLLFGVFSFMQFASSPFWGRMSDRIGRKGVILTGLIGTALAYLGFAYSQTMMHLFVTRALAGFFGATVPSAQAYIADVTEPADRARGMGKIGAAFGVGFTFGPLVGGELTKISLKAPGLMAAAFSTIAFVVGLINLVEPPRRERRVATSVRDVLRRHPRLWRLLGLHFFFMFSMSAFESMFTRYGLAEFPAVYGLAASVKHASLAELERAAPVAGRYLFFIGIISSIIQGVFTQRLVKRFGEKRLAVAGPIILATAFSLMALGSFLDGSDWHRWIVVLIGCGVAPFGFGLNNPSLIGLISRSVGPDDQGAALGLGQSAAGLGRVVGPPYGGFMFSRFFPAAPFISSACLLLVSAFLASRIDKVAPEDAT